MSAESGTTYRRVRRPRDKEHLLEQLRDDRRGAFRDIRDVVVFAAALGFERKRFSPFQSGGEAIRWETFINRPFSEDLVRMIAVAHSEDKEIAADARQGEQLEIFEGYVNGGLEVLDEVLSEATTSDPLDAVLDFLQSELGESQGADVLIELAGAEFD